MFVAYLTGLLLLLAPFVATICNAAEKTAPTYTIAFASFAPLNSDVFVADADGGNARPFLPDPELDSNASFSADGRWILFTSRRNGSSDIYRAHPDGSALERLVDDGSYDDQAALSPDGKLLAFVSSRSGQADIWIMDVGTRAVRNLTQHPAGDFRPAWSPDGQWLAFSSDRDSEHPRVPQNDFVIRHATAVYVMKVDGSELRRLTQAQPFAGSPSWSPQGNRLVFYSAALPEVVKITGARRLRGTTQIETFDVNTAERTTLTAGDGEKWSPRWLSEKRISYVSGGPEGGLEYTDGTHAVRGEFNSPSWSPDGRTMVFHREVEHAWPPHRSWPSLDPRFRLIRTGVFPAYAPSGAQMVSNDQVTASLHNSILLMDADGSASRVLFTLADKNALAPVWSPDGAQIAFAYGQFFRNFNGLRVADLAIIRPDGTGLRTLTDGKSNYGFPSWAPDGKHIVYREVRDDQTLLGVLELNSGKVRTLVGGPAHYNFPSWSPTRDLIAFTSDMEGDYEVYTIRSDGTQQTRLTRSPGNDAHNAWSPDGQWIAFASARGGFKDEAALHPVNPQPYGEICVMRADGSDVRVLTDEPFEKGTPTWVPEGTASPRPTERAR